MNTPTPTPLTLDVSLAYEVNEIPLRCRKPRLVRHTTTVEITIPVIRLEDMTHAFTVDDFGSEASEIYAYNDQLWAQPAHEATTPVYVEGEGWDASWIRRMSEADYTRFGYNVASEEDAVAELRKEMAGLLIADGHLYRPVAEPCYITPTFGLGNNHGGTGLMVSRHAELADRCFRADEFEAALARAIEIAEGRGDTEDVQRFKDHPEEYRSITVHAPEEVKLVTCPPTPEHIRDLRWEYACATDRLRAVAGYLSDTNADAEAEAFAEVVRLRKEIVAAGYAPVASREMAYEDRPGRRPE